MVDATVVPIVRSILGKIDRLPDVDDIRYSYCSKDLNSIKQLLNTVSVTDTSPKWGGVDATWITTVSTVTGAYSSEYNDGSYSSEWLNKIKNVIYYIDDLLDEATFDSLGQMHRLSSHLGKFRLKSNISDLRDRLAKLVRVDKNSKSVNSPILQRSTPALLEDGRTNVSQKIIGREKDKMDIITKILGLGEVPTSSVLVVYGVRGIGKTVLAKMVYKDMDNGLFDIKIWVSGTNRSRISILWLLRSILEAATGEITRHSDKEALMHMVKCALNYKRYLLVLDNVRNESEFSKVNYKFLECILDVGIAGSVILITTRNPEVASLFRPVEPNKLSPLSDSECWSIFK